MARFYLTVAKPSFDLFFALIFILFFGWLMLLIMLLFIISKQHPIFFFHRRTGYRKREFNLIKFRTLKNDDSLPLHQRTFWLGNLLRKTSLDELPQVIHIMKGEMSWIGPRPLPVEYLPLMNESQRMRYVVRPGITGWAQVNGRHEIDWKKKFELDNQYINTVSFALDLSIFFKTIVLLLQSKKDVSLSEKKFSGNLNASK